MDSYPYLSELLGGYFHQDAYDDAENDEEIMRGFRRSSWDYQRLGVRADIRRFLHQHRGDLLAAIERTFHPSLILGKTDAEAREWLTKIESLADDQGGEILLQSPPA